MEISATYKGETVTIVDRNAVAPTSATSLTIATSATGA